MHSLCLRISNLDFVLFYLKGGEAQRDLPSTGFISPRLATVRLGEAEARNLEPKLGFPYE